MAGKVQRKKRRRENKEERNGKERQRSEQERGRGRSRRYRRGRGGKTGLWSASMSKALSQSCSSGAVEIPQPQSRQGELVNKYLWVGADICKHS